MRFALLLLWLTTLAPAAHAADWLTWRRVGEATLTWGPFTVYHSQLRTPNGRYDGPQQDRALIITYRRDIDRDALVDATRDQWQAPRRPPLPRSARASRRRSAPAFSPSGSIRAPLIPNCVSS